MSSVCETTCAKYRKKLGITVENGSITTSARSKEEIEVKNVVSSIVMLNAIFTIVRKAHLFLNFDATSFQLSSEYSKKTKKVVTMKSEKGSQASKVRPNTGSHDLNYFIKYFCIITAGCVLCPFLMFLVADSAMNADEFATTQLLDCLTMLVLVLMGGFALPKLKMVMKNSSTGYLILF